MSSANALSTHTQSRRRFHARRRVDGLIYVDFGPDNGAILIDLGEGGLGFQSVAPVSVDQAILLKFKVPGDTNALEGYAEVAWLNESGKGGGLRFVELSPDARAQIRGFAGELTLPEPGALGAGNGAESQVAEQTAIEASSADAAQTGAVPEAVTSDDAPAQISQSFIGESTQPPSPEVPNLEANDADPETLRAAQAADQVPASQDAALNALPLPEFTVDVSAEPEASEPLDIAIDFESPLPVAPISAAQEVDSGASEFAPPLDEEQSGDDSADAKASEEYAGATSEIAKATAHLQPTVALHPSSVIAAPPHTEAGSDVSAKRAGVPRPSEFTPEIPQSLAAPPAKPARPLSSDSRNFAQPPKRQRRPAPSKPEASLPPAYRQDSTARGSFNRQSTKPAFASSERENLLDAQENDWKPQATLASPALKVGIGAAAGICLVLALVFGVPYLRTLMQTTANARSAASNLANSPPFQVEVADLNNRRWILRSGGDAGSPFGDTPSRRDTSSTASNASRKESAKPSGADDSGGSTETVTAPQPKAAKPAALALPKPLAKPADAPAAQLLAPSIFDGITPPVGSLTDRLPGIGPDVPGIVQPASPAASGRTSALQSAVLLQRVPPVYPGPALQAKVQGEVSVNATIGKDGIPKDLKVIKGDERLVAAALAAIRQWHYRPATLGGEPIETQTVVTVSFELK